MLSKFLTKLGLKKPKQKRPTDVIKEMGLDYLGVRYWSYLLIPRHKTLAEGPLTISRYACEPYKDVLMDELLRKPIPDEFVARIQQLFPDHEEGVNDRVITEQNLAFEHAALIGHV
jgi:hypothetical protein